MCLHSAFVGQLDLRVGLIETSLKSYFQEQRRSQGRGFEHDRAITCLGKRRYLETGACLVS